MDGEVVGVEEDEEGDAEAAEEEEEGDNLGTAGTLFEFGQFSVLPLEEVEEGGYLLKTGFL